LDERLELIHGLNLPPIETLRRSLRAYVDFGLENPSAYGFVFCVPPTMFEDVDLDTHNAILNVGVSSFDRLVEGIRVCIEGGYITAGEPVLKAQVTWLCMHGIVAGLIYNCGFPFVDKDLLIEHALDRVIGSLI
jgi:hypothetical protein